MPTYHIGGHPVRLDPSGWIARVPGNNLLFVMRLTDGELSAPDIAELRTERAVYDHYKPSRTVCFSDVDGTTVNEEYRLHEASDFELKGLVGASPLLASQAAEVEQLGEMIDALETRDLVRKVFADADLWKIFRQGLSVLQDELRGANGEPLRVTKAKTLKGKEGRTGKTPIEFTVEGLEKFGGYALFEEAIPESRSLDPARPALRTAFLTDNSRSDQRSVLFATLGLWQQVMERAISLDGMVGFAKARLSKVERVLRDNQKTALESTSELAESYIALSRFFANVRGQGDGRLFFLNADRTSIADTKDATVYKAIERFLLERNVGFDLNHSISGLILPGWIGGKEVVGAYSHLAYDHLCCIYTDCYAFDDYWDIKEEFEHSDIASSDKQFANAVMSAVWIQAREGEEKLGVEPVYFPGSILMAARHYMYWEGSDDLAVRKEERAGHADEVAVGLRKSQVETLCEMGLVVAQKVRGRMVLYGDENLHRGDRLERRRYSTVLLDDWILKVISSYALARSGELNKFQMREEVRRNIQTFFNDLKSAGAIERLIELDVRENIKRSDATDINIEYVPYASERSFCIRGEALDGSGNGVWNEGRIGAEVSQT